MGIISDIKLQKFARLAVDRCVRNGALKGSARPNKLRKENTATLVPCTGNADDARPGLIALGRQGLEKALREERRLGKSGHWSYDLNRHIALVQALENANKLIKPKKRE